VERQDVLAELQRRARAAGGGFTQTVQSLAAEWQEKPERLYYLIRSFVRGGELATVSHGPRGIEFRIGRQAPTGFRQFCPWCGRPAAADWRFCAGCGEPLPKAL